MEVVVVGVRFCDETSCCVSCTPRAVFFVVFLLGISSRHRQCIQICIIGFHPRGGPDQATRRPCDHHQTLRFIGSKNRGLEPFVPVPNWSILWLRFCFLNSPPRQLQQSTVLSIMSEQDMLESIYFETVRFPKLPGSVRPYELTTLLLYHSKNLAQCFALNTPLTICYNLVRSHLKI